MKDVIGYRVITNNGVVKEYKRYCNAYKCATKLISENTDCWIDELSVLVNENGIADLDTLKWSTIIGC